MALNFSLVGCGGLASGKWSYHQFIECDFHIKICTQKDTLQTQP